MNVGGHVVTAALVAAISVSLAHSAAVAGAPVVAGQPANAAGPGWTAAGRKIAVLGFDPLGMDPDKVARLEALFRMELERLAGGATPSARDIAQALRGSRLRNCAGDNRCLAAIGKKLGVNLVVSGNVAELGDSYVINIKVVNAQSGAELRRIASDPLRGSPDELIEAVRVAAYRLLAPQKLRGAITILADVTGADVRIDGTSVGKTPLARPVAGLGLGKHRLVVSMNGYSPLARDVVVHFQKTTRVAVRLAADPEQERLNLALAAAAAKKPRPAPRHFYDSTWFLVGAGVAAVVVGGVIGHALAGSDTVVDCSAMPGACR